MFTTGVQPLQVFLVKTLVKVVSLVTMKVKGMSKGYSQFNEDSQMVAFSARMSVGKKGVTQARFAKLIGASKSIVVKRESKNPKTQVEVKDDALVLYRFLIKLREHGLSEESETYLDNVRSELRSESNSIVVLTTLCFDKERMEIVREVVGLKSSKPSDNEELGGSKSMRAARTLIDELSDDLKKRLMFATDENAKKFLLDAILAGSRFSKLIELSEEALDEALKEIEAEEVRKQ